MDFTPKLFTQGTKIWIEDTKEVWQCAEILNDYNEDVKKLTFKIESNDVVKEIEIKTQMPYLRNPSILIGLNNLIELSYLNEPEILYNIKVRFCEQKAIYTYCGIVLVALNPYHELPIYGYDIMNAYRGKSIGDLDPHIFAVCEDAFFDLEREHKNQSIIISGESGAGKTVSAKYGMRYFATADGTITETRIEKQVLASNPIMESIGNARTTRNDNSSRFGKFIQLKFDQNLRMVGAKMQIYLLEKSRVIYQDFKECNYHIFYQMCVARQHLPSEFCLQNSDHYSYLNQANKDPEQQRKYFQDFFEVKQAFDLLKFNQSEQNDVFRMLAAILNCGNICFSEDHCSSSSNVSSAVQISDENDYFQQFCKLLCISERKMQKWFCFRQIHSTNEVCLIPMSSEKANSSKNALAKFMYEKLFHWIVSKINSALDLKDEKQCDYFIGILDIYGFETVENNSFEQFCINYANEKLQNQFNAHVFKLEQEDYIKEGIEWTIIEFHDNKSCIDLIESKLGILDLLDEECKLPKGSDSSWSQKIIAKYDKKNDHLIKAKFGDESFIISHFADRVEYQSDGFLEKNKDTVMNNQLMVLQKSDNYFCKSLFSDYEILQQPKRCNMDGSGDRILIKVNSAGQNFNKQQKHFKKSVGSQFRDSLNNLMEILNNTTPHYIRCVKPNDTKDRFNFNSKRVVQQLRACGVLETVRLSAAGYPNRCSYANFFQRYRLLVNSAKLNYQNIRDSAKLILNETVQLSGQYKYGRTKIFFRSGQIAYLERLRTERLRQACIRIQSVIRLFICRKRYLKVQKSIGLLQNWGRGLLARRKAQFIRQTKACTVIQKNFRGYFHRKRYENLKKTILSLQSACRGFLARKHYRTMIENQKAIVIQKNVRCWLQRKKYHKQRIQIVVCQKIIRGFLARRLFRKLKLEARSVEHFRNLNKGLENKIISLQHKIDELKKDNKRLTGVHQIQITILQNKEKSITELDTKLNVFEKKLKEKILQFQQLREELQLEQEEKIDLVMENNRLKEQIENQKCLKQVKESDQMQNDLNKMLKLQNQIEMLRNENTTLKNDICNRMQVSGIVCETMRIIELENENSQLKLTLRSIRNELEDDKKLQELKTYMDHLEKSLKLKINECENLKSILMQNKHLQIGKIDEDGELEMIYDIQKKINVQLEFELRKEREQFEIARKILKNENSKLKKKIEKQEDIIIGTKVDLNNESVNKMEFLRILNVNFELQDENQVLQNNCNQFKQQLIRFTKKMYELNLIDNSDVEKNIFANGKSTLALGMCEYNEGDEHIISRHLIKNMVPENVLNINPHLPAIIIFMCIRYTDYISNEKRLVIFINCVIEKLKKVIVKKKNDFDSQIFWLSNSVCLHNLLKQYSEDCYKNDNENGCGETKNEWSLQNFDLQEYRHVLTMICQQIYTNSIELISENLKKFIIPAVLEFNILMKTNSEKVSFQQQQQHEQSEELILKDLAPTFLIEKLSDYLKICRVNKLNESMITEIFDQIFYQINAISLNNLVLRKDLCCWSNGSCIRYNISVLETWIRKNNFVKSNRLIDTLMPINQAAYLLQARKLESDIDSICEMCNRLNYNQILKILHLYTPSDDFEERISVSFMETIQRKLAEKLPNTSDFLLNANEVKELNDLPYERSSVNFEVIELPDFLQLNYFHKI